MLVGGNKSVMKKRPLSRRRNRNGNQLNEEFPGGGEKAKWGMLGGGPYDVTMSLLGACLLLPLFLLNK